MTATPRSEQSFSTKVPTSARTGRRSPPGVDGERREGGGFPVGMKKIKLTRNKSREGGLASSAQKEGMKEDTPGACVP